jgi:hypothetical protein
VWAVRSRSTLFELPLSVLVDQCRRWGLDPEVPPVDAGPFSLGDGAVVHRILGGAGWRDVTIEPRVLKLVVGGGVPPVEAARAALESGPARVVAEALDDDQRRRVIDAIAEAYGEHVDEHGHVVLEATPVLVAARRPT